MPAGLRLAELLLDDEERQLLEDVLPLGFGLPEVLENLHGFIRHLRTALDVVR